MAVVVAARTDKAAWGVWKKKAAAAASTTGGDAAAEGSGKVRT